MKFELVMGILAMATSGMALEASNPIGKNAHEPKVIVIGHRGASGERPEHTLASYEKAIAEGADYIEPDLVLTKDGVFVARHENNITDTTDVADHAEFANRKTTKMIDGQQETGWFTEDFTLAELKTLRAKERLPQLRPENAKYDGKFEIPTLAEVIALAKRATKETGRTIGIYPETKHPTYFASIGLPMEKKLVEQLHAAGWDKPSDPVFIQSFEVNNLKQLHRLTQLRLIQLLDNEGGPADGAAPSYAAMITPGGLKQVARYAYGIGPNFRMIESDDGKPTQLITNAHAAGLKVHPWTFRAENYFLLSNWKKGDNPTAHGDIVGMIRHFINLRVDGFFTDFPYAGVEARDGAGKGD